MGYYYKVKWAIFFQERCRIFFFEAETRFPSTRPFFWQIAPSVPGVVVLWYEISRRRTLSRNCDLCRRRSRRRRRSFFYQSTTGVTFDFDFVVNPPRVPRPPLHVKSRNKLSLKVWIKISQFPKKAKGGGGGGGTGLSDRRIEIVHDCQNWGERHLVIFWCPK